MKVDAELTITLFPEVGSYLDTQEDAQKAITTALVSWLRREAAKEGKRGNWSGEMYCQVLADSLERGE